MKGKIVKVFLGVIATLLIFSSVAPSYASAKTSVANTTTNSIAQKDTSLASTDPKLKNPVVQPQSIKTKAVGQALRYGGYWLNQLIKKIPYKWADRLGDSVERWGHTAANVVDELTEYGETAVTIALMKAGIPPNDAILMAKFITFFLP
ncbi:hypothetical protein [Aquibacillus rhizosphaerae]|uniref:Uncharacterized protein n=1 Tax=Aquibacillus rhizosphaerae TaxID=3051431 RepID=A0ABT7LAG8_9BACI|nr:hypothetical protein [Aquibacillus sp. LR5S19]MDL4842853.1 hypothetical protein [Aquibacillus sp. LR5S19]